MTNTLAIETRIIQNVKGRTGASQWMFLGVFIGGAIASAFLGVSKSDLLTGLLFFSGISVIPLLLIFS